mmetsp:Transcript_68890/g.143853  ORF Transcript_68890/g.143853 Transcript_68890/m.143853 type:complete len:99 (+) Transcript_68890:283-579(+)
MSEPGQKSLFHKCMAASAARPFEVWTQLDLPQQLGPQHSSTGLLSLFESQTMFGRHSECRVEKNNDDATARELHHLTFKRCERIVHPTTPSVSPACSL